MAKLVCHRVVLGPEKWSFFPWLAASETWVPLPTMFLQVLQHLVLCPGSKTAQHVIPGDEDVFRCQSGGVGSASLKKICLLNWDSPAKDACYINGT